MKSPILLAGLVVLALSTTPLRADVKVVFDHNENQQATPSFKFKQVPLPSAKDEGTKAKFAIVDGVKDDNGGELDKLHDGKLPTEEDQPSENFFFDAGTEGGRVQVDLGSVISIRQINTYSWHPRDRGPQLYNLYASDGKADGFNPRPKKSTKPDTCGWKLVAKVDTRPKGGDAGGQYGVSISDSDGALGNYQYLLFDMARTEDTDDFGNTFYSEIDVVGSETAAASAEPASPPLVVHSTDNYCEITIDTSGAPDVRDWAEKKLAPVLADWYPKITKMLASDGYEAPKAFRVMIRPGRGVAATGGTNVTVNSAWLERELNREGVGAILHEEVHVVQRYGGGRRTNSDGQARVRPPGWLVEGIPDYIRWYIYEPQSHGADAVYLKNRRNVNLNYDGMYRITANFLNYVVSKSDQSLITKLNAACRQGTYNEEIFKTATGKTLAELNDEWKEATQKEIAALRAADPATAASDRPRGDAKPNTLTEAEKAAGWRLLFNGADLTGWHNFKSEGVKPGWQVKDGLLACVDPHNAGDIVTADQFEWFELQLDYNISEGGNSGIMFHVSDQGNAAWASGPEFQLEDNAKAADPVRCGWLYGLYQPPMDPKTEKPLDATKPAGEWNHIRLLITPEKCVHEINGVKYFEYVLGSEDFKSRVAKSKFGRMSLFAKSNSGHISLQGDHGQVSFRNIKIRSVKTGS